jgi:hypothetical protein
MYFWFGGISRKGAKAYLSRKENQIETLPSRILVWLFRLSSIKLHHQFRNCDHFEGFPAQVQIRQAAEEPFSHRDTETQRR